MASSSVPGPVGRVGRVGPGEQLEPVGFPGCRRCPVRHRSLPEVCRACFDASTPTPAPPACPVCGQALRRAGPCANRWCGRADRAYSSVFALGTYDGPLRRAIVAYKYGGQRWWGGVFARLLAGELSRHAPWFEEFDLLVGVPACLAPGARRSWDPVGVVLDQLIGLLGCAWEVAPAAIVKDADTAPMSRRSRFERSVIAQRDLRRALRVPDPSSVAGRRVLVVDDVFTEGSTLQEVARAVRKAGAAEVAGLVLARPPWAAG